MDEARRRGPDADVRSLQGRGQPAATDAARGARADPVGDRRHVPALPRGGARGAAAARRRAGRALADGRIYSAQQALANGLVDQVGDVEEAVGVARARAGLAEARVVTYHRPREYRKNLFTAAIPLDAPARRRGPRRGSSCRSPRSSTCGRPAACSTEHAPRSPVHPAAVAERNTSVTGTRGDGVALGRAQVGAREDAAPCSAAHRRRVSRGGRSACSSSRSRSRPRDTSRRARARPA